MSQDPTLPGATPALPGDGVDEGTGAGTASTAAGVAPLLDGLEELPPAEHVARFEAVHEQLRDRLSGGAA